MFGKTHSTKTTEVEKKWLVIDAEASWSDARFDRRPAAARQAQTSFTPRSTTTTTSSWSTRKRSCSRPEARPEGLPPLIRAISAASRTLGQSILEGRFPERIVEKRSNACCRAALGKKQLDNLRVYKARTSRRRTGADRARRRHSTRRTPSAENNG